ncbi:Uncharacterised protein [BD1-7 clade bacterium]|uniref:Lipoprotein n=1 Tax=BD1-7 clade bacterium TaxID=2029982 RepID=A0A5S9NXB4_9GAMM|nr:Uncharacterised protein [BD1-7 clade bacterium]CAA0095445.1 Uncharacterised protein [BD1-7 clade bacterium]
MTFQRESWVKSLAMPAVGLLMAGFWMTGCSDDDDDRPSNTSNIGANMYANGMQDGSTGLTATFFRRVNGNDEPIRLDLADERDTILASLNGIIQNMTERLVDDIWVYETSYSNANAEDTQFQIELTARSLDLMAVDSFLVLPPASSFSMPASGSSVNFDDTVSFVWNNSGSESPVTIESEGTCNTGQQVTFSESNLPDSGSFAIVADQLAGEPTRTDLTECTLQVTIIKQRDGELDQRYVGGEALARQMRFIALTVVYAR